LRRQASMARAHCKTSPAVCAARFACRPLALLIGPCLLLLLAGAAVASATSVSPAGARPPTALVSQMATCVVVAGSCACAATRKAAAVRLWLLAPLTSTMTNCVGRSASCVACQLVSITMTSAPAAKSTDLWTWMGTASSCPSPRSPPWLLVSPRLPRLTWQAAPLQ
jgi:hypothetical protein